MKTFEDYLQDQFFEEEPQTLDDQFPDAFIGWLENLDIEEIIDYANKFFKEELKRRTEEVVSYIGRELPKLRDHTCRFNDGECECDCYKGCLQEIKNIIKNFDN